MITDDHTQCLPTITHNDYRRPHTVIIDGHTQWPPAITHNDYRWSHIMIFYWRSHILITGGHTQWLPAVTHNDYRRSHTMITDGHMPATQLLMVTHNDYHTQWLPAVTRWSHNYRWSTHNDYRRSHTIITDDHTLVLHTATSTQWLPTVTRSCCMPPSVASNMCTEKSEECLSAFSNERTHPPPPPLITKWMWMVFLKSQCCILRLLPIPLIWCETFRGNGNNVTITSRSNENLSTL